MNITDDTTQPFKLKKGFFSKEIYDDYHSMNESSSDNWGYNCTYQLKPHGLNGEHKFLQLDTMQLSYANRPGGMMHDVNTAKGSIAIAIMEEIVDKACFDSMKLQSGDIFFFDDSKSFNFMSNDMVKLSVISIHKKSLGNLLKHFNQALNYRLRDKDKQLSILLHKTWNDFTKKRVKVNYEVAEEMIVGQLKKILETQPLIATQLTKGEKIALSIRNQVYNHMDGNISIGKFAKEYNISEKTIQTSFKSLFGFTPKYFIRQLKLNLIHNELKKSNTREGSVSEIAFKWGFKHMGQFSHYYTELFGVNPSWTLRKDYHISTAIAKSCVSRQEEMI